jgi:predicted ester cyclase
MVETRILEHAANRSAPTPTAGTRRAAGAGMTNTDPGAIARRVVEEIFVRGRLESIDELVAPGFVSHTFSFTDDGREQLRAATQRVHASLSDVTFEVEDVVVEGDQAVVRLTSSATPIGDFMGVPAGGKRYTIGEMHWFRVESGKVVEHWHQHDALGLMKQLGAFPAPDVQQA